MKLLVSLWIVAVSAAMIACGRSRVTLNEIERAKSGSLEVIVLSPRESLTHGRDDFFIEFRKAGSADLVGVGDVRATASMSMSGVPMFGSIDVKPTGTAGRYEASGNLSMAGTWRVTIQWSGGAEPGSASFSGNVR